MPVDGYPDFIVVNAANVVSSVALAGICVVDSLPKCSPFTSIERDAFWFKVLLSHISSLPVSTYEKRSSELACWSLSVCIRDLHSVRVLIDAE